MCNAEVCHSKTFRVCFTLQKGLSKHAKSLPIGVGSSKILYATNLSALGRHTRSTGTAQLDAYFSVLVPAGLKITRRSNFSDCCKITLSSSTSPVSLKSTALRLRSRSSIRTLKVSSRSATSLQVPLVVSRPKVSNGTVATLASPGAHNA